MIENREKKRNIEIEIEQRMKEETTKINYKRNCKIDKEIRKY